MTDPKAGRQQQLLGHVDAFLAGGLHGWAALRDEAGGIRTSIRIVIVHEDAVIAETNAVLPRADVAGLIGGDGQCGFAALLPARYLDGARYTVRILAAEDHAELHEGPFTFQEGGEAPESRFVTARADLTLEPKGFFDPEPVRQAAIRNRENSLFIHDLGELFPAYRMLRPAPAVAHFHSAGFESELLRHFTTLNAGHGFGVASRIVRLEDVYVHNNRILGAVDGRVLTVYETARPNDRPYTTQPDWTEQELKSAAIEMTPERPMLFLGSPGFANYGHWLVDDLPRAAAGSRIAADGRVQAVIPGCGSRLDTVKSESLQTLFPDTFLPAPLFISTAQTLFFKELHYVTPVSYHPVLKSPDGCRLLRERLHRHTTASGRPGRRGTRLYVTRDSRHGRRIVNQDQVDTLLARYGFVVFNPENASFVDQASTFSRAELIVGCMGAAMTNSLFADAGSKLLYLAPGGWTEPFYWDLAAVCGHSYNVFYGRPVSTDEEAHKSDFVIDCNELSSVLSSLA